MGGVGYCSVDSDRTVDYSQLSFVEANLRLNASGDGSGSPAISH
jgi:hypothetical protein